MSEERGGCLRIADTCKCDNREQGFGKPESFERFRSLLGESNIDIGQKTHPNGWQVCLLSDTEFRCHIEA